MRRNQPQKIGEILTELMTRRGYARLQSNVELASVWRDAAGPMLASQTRVGRLARGTLEVVVAHNLLIQELTYQTTTLIAALGKALPDQNIKRLRFRVGTVDEK